MFPSAAFGGEFALTPTHIWIPYFPHVSALCGEQDYVDRPCSCEDFVFWRFPFRQEGREEEVNVYIIFT